MSKQRGFNIIELMTIVALMGVLITLGLPNLQIFLLDNRITSQINSFSSALALARSEAVKNNARVVVCPARIAVAGNPPKVECDDSGVDWNSGWITYIDRSPIATDRWQVHNDAPVTGDPNDGPCGVSAGDDDDDDCVLTYIEELLPADSMTLRSPAADSLEAVAYTALGSMKRWDGSAELADGETTFVLCDHRGDESAKAIIVSTTGRAAISTTASDGSALSCSP